MATGTNQTPKTITRSQSFEILLVQLPPTERAVVEWNTSSPRLLGHLAADARAVGDEGDEYLVADVSPSYVLVFRDKLDRYELLDLMSKQAVQWKEPPPAGDGPRAVNGRAKARRDTPPRPATGKVPQ
jgi:hypothetical protein